MKQLAYPRSQNQIHGKVFNYVVIRSLVGIIALSLAALTLIITNFFYPDLGIPTSISVTYYTGARDLFVGCLFIVSAFLFSYNGYQNSQYPYSSLIQSILSKIAGVCAACVALFPTDCNTEWIQTVTHGEVKGCSEQILFANIQVSHVHIFSAILLFLILALFCLYFFQQSTQNGSKEQRRRSVLYKICGWSMLLAIAIGFWDYFFNTDPDSKVLFWVEMACLIFFGIAWIVAGKQFTWLGLATPLEKQGKG